MPFTLGDGPLETAKPVDPAKPAKPAEAKPPAPAPGKPGVVKGRLTAGEGQAATAPRPKAAATGAAPRAPIPKPPSPSPLTPPATPRTLALDLGPAGAGVSMAPPAPPQPVAPPPSGRGLSFSLGGAEPASRPAPPPPAPPGPPTAPPPAPRAPSLALDAGTMPPSAPVVPPPAPVPPPARLGPGGGFSVSAGRLPAEAPAAPSIPPPQAAERRPMGGGGFKVSAGGIAPPRDGLPAQTPHISLAPVAPGPEVPSSAPPGSSTSQLQGGGMRLDAPPPPASPPPAPPAPKAAAPMRAPTPPAAPPPAAASAPSAPGTAVATARPGGGTAVGAPGKPPARLGDQLVEMGLISKDQLQVALLEKRNSPKMMGELLVDLGFITEQALAAVLAESSGFRRFELGKAMIEPELLRRLPKEIAQRYRVFPVSTDGGKIRVAMADVYDVLAIDQMKRYYGADVNIEPLVCAETEIVKAIDQYYGHELSIDGILRELESSATAEDLVALDASGSYTHPIVRLVDAILLDSVKQKASDIHFEPEGNFLRVRYRIDGEMTQVRTIHKRHWPAFSHRLKLMSGMNIADKLNPQDGRFSLAHGSQRIDFRVSSLPTVHGENLVLRILDKSAALVPLQALGYTQENFALLTKMIKRPEGIVIVTGPTGSGKTTTLYSVLNFINSLELNIMTLEDPVEYELSLIRQSQVREGTNMTFAEGIRTLLRQDPDVILVGEVRDPDTAQMALRAAMTGHQVYTTLHTNDAAGAIPRLIDLGMRPQLMAGNIIGIVAQRLGRKLCPDCRRPKEADEMECKILGADPKDPPIIYEPVGCPACRGTGHRGRVAVSEILPFNDEIDEMIIQEASLSAIRKEATKYGFVPIVDDGLRKVREGVLSIPALMRCVDVTDRL